MKRIDDLTLLTLSTINDDFVWKAQEDWWGDKAYFSTVDRNISLISVTLSTCLNENDR